jgi:hypothetical protein
MRDAAPGARAIRAHLDALRERVSIEIAEPAER